MMDAAPTIESASLPIARIPIILSLPAGPTINFTTLGYGDVVIRSFFEQIIEEKFLAFLVAQGVSGDDMCGSLKTFQE